MDWLSSSKIRREQLKPGDHIYVWRRCYSYAHHGIYVGEEKDQEVIHLTRTADKDYLVPCTMKDFLRGGDLNLYEYGVRPARFLIKRGGTCTRASSDPPEDVLHRASILQEKGFGDYDLFHNNCEDFAIYCKTGFLKVDMSKPGRSQQIQFLTAALFAVISTPYQFLPATFACLALVVFGLYCGFRLARDSGVEKVEVEKIVDLRYQRDRSGGTVLRMPSGSRAKWFLTAGEYLAYALIALRYWYWTPTSRILLWLRLLVLYGCAYTFVTDHLRDHASKLKLREDVACIIWLLGYWYWGSSDITIFLSTKFMFLYSFLKFCVSDPEKLQDYLSHTTLALVYGHWTPKFGILSWIQLCFGLSYIFTHFSNPRSRLLLCMLFLLYMFRNPIGSHLIFGLGF